MTIEGTHLAERDRGKAGLGELTPEDAERYLPLMEDIELSEEQKREFLGVIWNILLHFVNMGFDLREVDICGQLLDGFNECAVGDTEGVGSKPAINTEKSDDREGTP